MSTTMYVADSGVIVMGRAGSLPMSPSLIANVALRLVLCPVAILITWVPLRLLWRHGEFPACVYVLNVWLEIFFVFINAAIWHNQTFDSWWLGYGWCDVVTYLQVPMITAYSASVCAIMQRLSSQVGLTRVSGLSAREKRHRVITQSVAIFSVPLLQVALTIFVQARRYSLAPGVGCTTQFYPTAVFLVFFHLPPLLFTLMACYHTVQTYRKFHDVDTSSRRALADTNTVAFARRQRARRKLYLMVLCILVPYTPISIAFFAIHIIDGWPWNYPSSFDAVHVHGLVPWNSIVVLGYADVGFIIMNFSWIPVVSAFIAFVFFGTSKEAINTYRTYLLALGLGRIFPKLREAYDPDRSPLDSTSSTAATQLSTLTSAMSQSRKGSFAPGFQPAEPVGAVSSVEDNVSPPRPSSKPWRRMNMLDTSRLWPRKTNRSLPLSSTPRASPDYSRSAAPSRTPFNTGVNWFTPPLPKLPAFFGSRSQPVSAPPPTSSASTTAPILGQMPAGGSSPIQERGHSRRDLFFPRATAAAMSNAIFDGTDYSGIDASNPTAAAAASKAGHASISGKRAISTHVWSDGHTPTAAPDAAAGGGRGSSGRSASGWHASSGSSTRRNSGGFAGVQVERSITSKVTG